MFVYLVNGDTVKMTREQMLDNVIAKYGFEVEETIEFAYLCERGTNEQVAQTYEKLMN
jgi:predicted HAD superfamily Cof-like phosphohydrolase